MTKKQIVKKSKFKLVDVYEETRGTDEPQIIVELSYKGYHFTRLIDVGSETLKYTNRDIRQRSSLKLDTAKVRKAYQLRRYEEQ